MKNLLKKSAVATAVAGSLMISGVASADSLLASLVVGVSNGAQTYFSIKARGKGTANARMASSSMSDLHYVWFKKGSSVADLYNLNTPCEVSNNNGAISPWDMVLQRAVDNDTAVNLDPADDHSVPAGYNAGNFVGFAVITDSANVNANPAVKDLANEGELSGFGYVVDASNSFVLDYKLLNNHRSKVEGDFSAGFISKKSIDYSWMPIDIASTTWSTVVTGDDMLKSDSGAGSYDATVYISQDTAAGSVSPQLPTGGSGVYNNDEKVTSGAKNFKVTCMGWYDTTTLLNTLQATDTVNGGWKRMSVQNSTTRTAINNGVPASVATTQVASGAITYKLELLDFSPNAAYAGAGVAPEILAAGNSAAGALAIPVSDGTPYDVSAPVRNNGVISYQPETSGHLSASPEPHPNRPY